MDVGGLSFILLPFNNSFDLNKILDNNLSALI